MTIVSHSKVWFLTGASRGFGRIWVEAALKRGDKVAATARNPADLIELVTRYGDSVLPLQLDVTDRAAVFAAVHAAHGHFGRLDVIVSNAGYGYMGAVEELAPEEVKANFETNVFGTLSLIQAALPILRVQGGGHILTVSSIGGILAFPTGGSYTASKFVIEAITEALAKEVASFGIKVTIIEPGNYATEFNSAVRSAKAMSEYEGVRQSIRASMHGSQNMGNPAATGAAILKVVDAQDPPLRLVLGATTIPRFKAAYEQRLQNWDNWAEVSIAAHGTPSENRS
jgi:NAD(P)-dependent dehydrogenase (short-subunit alcohol dehydrogenase family)